MSNEVSFEVWIEGDGSQGSPSKAQRLLRQGESDSKWDAISFQQAVVMALNELKWTMLYEAPQGLGTCYYDYKTNRYWGCNFYDNEADARKPFG